MTVEKLIQLHEAWGQALEARGVIEPRKRITQRIDRKVVRDHSGVFQRFQEFTVEIPEADQVFEAFSSRLSITLYGDSAGMNAVEAELKNWLSLGKLPSLGLAKGQPPKIDPDLWNLGNVDWEAGKLDLSDWLYSSIKVSEQTLRQLLSGATQGHPTAAVRPRGKIPAVVKAIEELWPGGIPIGVSAKERREEIESKLSEGRKIKKTVSPRTIERALEQISSTGTK